MSSKVYKDKHNNIIKFNPYEKKRRYEVNGEIMNGCTSVIDPRFGKDGLVGWAKKKPIEQINASDLGVDTSPRIEQIKVEEPPKRKAGIKVKSVAELVQKLKNEAKVI